GRLEVCDGAQGVCDDGMRDLGTDQTRKLRDRLIRVRIVPQWKKTNSITATTSRSCASTSRMSRLTSSTSIRLSTAVRTTTYSSPKRTGPALQLTNHGFRGHLGVERGRRAGLRG